MSKDFPFARFHVLLSDFGYKLEGKSLIQKGIRGFTSDRIIISGFDNAMAACEYLCPIVNATEFTNRLVELGRPTK
jgi:hypothetical protein